MSITAQILIGYGSLTLATFSVASAVAWTELHRKRARLAARVAITAPLWPLWIVGGLVWVVVANIRFLVRQSRA